MYDWNDLKAFLAVARSGSTLAASRALRVNQTTVARRIEGLETALGLRLFERGQSGSRLTEAGRDLLAEADQVERAAMGFSNRARAHQRGLAGVIRITCTEMLANELLTPAIGHFRRQYPEVQIELIVSDDSLDVAGGEVDMAIRSGYQLPPSDLVARKLTDWSFALYCSREYAERHGAPQTPEALRDHDLLSCETPRGSSPGVAWMLAQAGGKAPVHVSNSMTNLAAAVRAGLGVAPLNCLVADADSRLIRCSEPIAEANAHSWIVVRREMKDLPRIRALIDFLAPFVQADVRSREARNAALRGAAAE